MGTQRNGIVCPRCGWQNDAIARMCGGCGQPLPLAAAPAPADSPYPGTVTLPSATRYASPVDDTPTLIAPLRPAPAPPPDAPPHPAYRPGAAPAWPAASGSAPYVPTARGAPRTAPARRRGNCLVRALVTLLVVVVVLGCLGVGTWTLLIRPPLHAKMDGGIRTAIGAVVSEANVALGRLPPGVGGSAQIPAALVNDQLQSNVPSSLPIHNVSLDFAAGGVVVHYTMAGGTGYLYAGLAAQGGRLVVRSAAVTGPLKLIESSSELQQAVSDELAGLTSSVAITKVSTADHTLSMTVKASGG